MTYRPWWTGLGAVALACLLPGAGLIMLFFVPGVLAAQGLEAGRKQVWLLWPLLGLLAVILGSYLGGGLFLGLELVLLSWILFRAAEKGLDIPTTLLFTMALLGLYYGLLLAYGYYVRGVDVSALTSPMEKGLKEGLSPYKLGEVETQQVVATLMGLVPFMVALTVVAVTYMNIIVANYWAKHRRLRGGRIFYPRFESFRLPDALIWLGIVAGAGHLFGHGELRLISTNLLLTILALYCIQGAGMIKYFMNRYRVNRLLQALVFLLISSSWYGLVGVTIMGVSDVWTNVRKTPLQEGDRSKHTL